MTRRLMGRVNLRGTAKSALRLVAAVLIAFPQPLWANPTAGEVAAGSAGISSSGGTLTVIQASNNAIINWRDFSISQGELTRFIQPSALSAVLNRVTGGDPSAIYGALQANGRVFLINPNGITVGPTGVINTQSFVASTLDVNNDQFMSGGSLRFSGGSAAELINAGRINALGGDVVLIARTVRNTGDIAAPQGAAALAAGTEVLLQPSGDERVFVKAGGEDKAAAGVDQQGRIAAATAELKAAGGNVYSLAINNSGIVQATGVERRGGRVYLVAEGGSIALRSGSVIDASGANGGGTVLVGGDSRGLNPDVPNASVVTVEQGATIKADALESGDGGKVVVWGTDSASFKGLISAKGGAEGGGGGDVEVSGGRLNFGGMVDVTAPRGLLGSLLLDPFNLTISNSVNNEIDTTNPDSSTGDGSNLSVATLVGQLANANVTVQTGGNSPSSQLGDITVADAVTWGGPTAGSLTLIADNDIIVNSNAAITSNGGGAVQLSANNGNGAIVLNSNITTTGGGQTYSGAVALGGDVTLNTGGGNLLFSNTIDSLPGGGRNLSIASGAGNVTFAGAVGGGEALGSLSIDGAGVIHIDGGMVSTVGRQRYGEAVVLGGQGTDAELTSGGGGVAFDWRVDGGKNLSIAAGAGDVTFSGFVGGGEALSSLSIDGAGATYIDGGMVSTVGRQRYGEAVVLGGQGTDTELRSGGGGVAFDWRVDGGRNLSIAAGAGDVTFSGFVGGGEALSSLSIDGAGVTRIDGGAVTTGGAQRYGEAVVLGGQGTDTELTSGGGGMAFDRTVDGGKNLIINAGEGDVTFSGAAGGGEALSALYVNGAGVTHIDGGAVATVGAQHYNEAVVLGGAGANTSLTSAGEGVTFNYRVDGGRNLSIAAGAGDVTFEGFVGGGEALGSLSVDGAAAARTIINGGAVTTDGAQRYGEAVVLGGQGTDMELTSGGGGVAFDRTVDGGKNLIINAGEGDVTFSGAAGGGEALSALYVNGDGATHIDGGIVATVGQQRYGEAVVLGGSGAGTEVASDGGSVAFDRTVDGGRSLSIASGAGDTTFAGAVGEGEALSSLSVDGAGVTHIDGGIVATVGRQRYDEAVVLGGTGANTALTSAGEGVTFNYRVDGGRNLSIASGVGDVTFEGFVGLGTALGSLDIAGDAAAKTIINGGAVTTDGAQRYGEAVVLGGQGTDMELTSGGGGMAFGRTVDGGKNLIINAGEGDVTFSGAAGGGAALSALYVNGAGVTYIDGGAVATVGAQHYNEAVVLGGAGANTSLISAGEGVTFNYRVDGGRNLGIGSGAGDVTFADAVGGGEALSSLSVDGAGVTRIDGGIVTTVGRQRYGESVVLGGQGTDATLASGGGGIVFDGGVNGERNLAVDAGAGDILLNGPVSADDVSLTGANTAWNAALAARNLRIFGKDILMGGDVASEGADGVLMVASNSFKNPGSHAVTTAGGGRFLIYSVSPDRNILGGLAGSTQYDTTYLNGPQPGFLGNGFLYSDPAWVLPPVNVNYGAINNSPNPLYGWLLGGGRKPAIDEDLDEDGDNGSASSSDLFPWDLGTMRDAVASSYAPNRKRKKRK